MMPSSSYTRRNISGSTFVLFLLLPNVIFVSGTSPFTRGGVESEKVAWVSPSKYRNDHHRRLNMRNHFASSFCASAATSITLSNGEMNCSPQLSKTKFFSKKNNAENEEEEEESLGTNTIQNDMNNISRRNLLHSTTLGLLTTMTLTNSPKPANAGLIQFPTPTLMNTYHLMRAGQSLLEEENLYMSNPLFLTNREAALSPLGIEQVQRASEFLEAQNINPSLLKYTTAANSMDTADIVQANLRVGRNRMVPEYTYMDPRGIGSWELLPLKETEEAVWAMDVLEGGNDGMGGRPPPKDDGTPHEVLADQVTRLRQLISLLESTLSGDSILLIFPDGTGPAVLSCLFAGIPLNRVHELNFAPGEVRLDVNYNTVQTFLSAREQNEEVQQLYQEKIDRGTKQLDVLRSNPGIMNERDLAYEESVLAAKKQQRDAERLREEERKERMAAKEREKEEYRKKQEEIKKQVLLEKQLERERKMQEQSEKKDEGLSLNEIVGGVGAAGAAAVFATLANSNSDKEKKVGEKVSGLVGRETEVLESSTSISSNTTISDKEEEETADLILSSSSNTTNIDRNDGINSTASSILSPEIQRMEELMERAPIQIPEIKDIEAREEEEAYNREKRAQDAMKEYLDRDDGGDAWLEFITDLASEVDDALEEENRKEGLMVNGINENNTLSLS